MTPSARRLAILISLVLLLIAPNSVVATTASDSASSSVIERAPVDRVSGADRYATAVAISRAAFPASARTVYLARGDVSADALAGGALTDGPVLLVRPCGAVPSSVTAEVVRLNPGRVVALGGAAAVCDDVLRTVARGRPTGRLAGSTRFATAVAISRHAFPTGGVEEVYVASGGDSPDPVAGGILTAGPVLLLPPASGVPSVVREEILRLAPGRVVALGGTGAVSDTQLATAGDGRATHRLAGTNRYATSAAIAAYEFPSRPASVYLARGDVFADAIAGGSLTDGPILLIQAGASCVDLPLETKDYLRSAQAGRVVALGAQGTLCDSLLNIAAYWSRGLHIVTESLPPAVVGEPYDAVVEVRTNSFYGPTVFMEALPPGLGVEPETLTRQRITGVPTEAGTFAVTITAHEMWARITTRTLQLTVARQAGQGAD